MVKTSEETAAIFKALAEFQQEVKQPKKDANNPFFKSKYVPLENVVEVIHEAASKHGLAESTYPAQSELGVGVGVLITHSSGEFIQYDPIYMKPDKNTPQGIGSALTYARRYALSAAFGIASEVDDDGNESSGNNQKPNNNKQAPQPNNKPKPVTQTQQKALQGALETLADELGKSYTETEQTIFNAQGIEKELSKLTNEEYGHLLNYIKQLTEKYKKKA